MQNAGIAVSCADPASVYEGSPDITFDCTTSGVDPGTTIAYFWTSPSAPDGYVAIAIQDILSPLFNVPENVDEGTDYEYLLTASAASGKITRRQR